MKHLLAAVSFAALAAATPAAAAYVTYTNQAAFNAAVTGATTSGISGGFSGAYQSVAPAYTQGAATFSAPGLGKYNDNAFGTGVIYLAGSAGSGTTIALDTGFRAFSLTYGLYSGAGTVDVAVNGSSLGTFAAAGRPGTSFLGIVSDDLISSLSFAKSGDASSEFDVVNFTTADAAPAVSVPEPAMVGLFGLGALGLALSRRRKAA